MAVFISLAIESWLGKSSFVFNPSRRVISDKKLECALFFFWCVVVVRLVMTPCIFHITLQVQTISSIEFRV